MRGQLRGKPTVVVAGLGLIGGSIARGLARGGWRVLGVDRARPLREAVAARAIAEGFVSLAVAARQAQVVFLAAPPRANLRLLRELAVMDPRPPVITDVGSAKRRICSEARRLGLRGFVGGHPMAGSERSGFGASSPDLFRGRPWLLVHERSAAAPARVVRALVKALGARPRPMTAATHDRAVAFLSHLPQLAAWALAEAAQRDAVTASHLDVAGPGFADMTRLAGSPRALWADILAENRREVKRALRAFRTALAGATSGGGRNRSRRAG